MNAAHAFHAALLATLACATPASQPRPAPPAATPAAQPPAAPALPPAPEPAVRSPEAAFQCARAQALLATGHLEQAIAGFREAVIFDFESAYLHAMLAQALLQAGRGDEALEQAQAAVALDPQDEEGHRVLAQVLWSTGRHQDAVPELERVVAARPARREETQNLLSALVDVDQVARARQVWMAHAAASGTPASWTLLAEVCVDAGQWECALSTAQEAALRAPESAAVCGMAARVEEARGDPGKAAAGWGACAARLGPQPELVAGQAAALSAAGDVAGLRALLAPLAAPWAAQPASIQVAHALAERGALEDVLWWSAQVRDAGGGSHLAWQEAQAMAALGMCVQMQASLARAGALDQDQGRAAWLQASCLLRRGQPSKAVLILADALPRQPHSPDLVKLQCLALARAGEPAAAGMLGRNLPAGAGWLEALVACQQAAGRNGLDDVDAALARSPEDPALLELGAVTALQEQQPARAREWARVLTSVRPRASRGWALLAQAQLALGGAELLKAPSSAERAVALEPASTRWAALRAWAAAANGQGAGALGAMASWQRMLRGDPQALLWAGDACHAAGQLDAAKVLWRLGADALPLDAQLGATLASRLVAP